MIETEWTEVCDLAELTEVDRNTFWHRQFLNPYATEGYDARRAQGSIRVTVPSPLSTTQTAVSPTATAPRFGADRDRGAVALAAGEVDAGDRVLAGERDPDGAGAGVDPAGALADFDRVAADGVGRRGRPW